MTTTTNNEVTIETTKRTSSTYELGSFVDAIMLNGVEIGQLYRRSVNDIFPTVFIGEKKFEIDIELVELHYGKPEIDVVIILHTKKSTQLNRAYTAKTDWLWINGTPSVATIKALAIRIAEEQRN
tara:strand:+ start:279 stop:653 length:375 start_codon:yes stop_codon:yes gene_type:complete